MPYQQVTNSAFETYGICVTFKEETTKLRTHCTWFTESYPYEDPNNLNFNSNCSLEDCCKEEKATEEVTQVHGSFQLCHAKLNFPAHFNYQLKREFNEWVLQHIPTRNRQNFKQEPVLRLHGSPSDRLLVYTIKTTLKSDEKRFSLWSGICATWG